MWNFKTGRFQHSIQACHHDKIVLFVMGYGLDLNVRFYFSAIESRLV